MRTILLCIAFAFLVGCASKRYSEFTGNQPWPVVQGSMADHAYAIPVYHGWPEKPYRVIGSIRFSDMNTEWKQGDTAHAARIGKRRGGDAIIMRYGAEFGVGAITAAAADPKIITTREITALVIKWKSEKEIAAERQVQEQFYQDFKAKNKEAKISKELVSVGAEYISSLGLKLDSPEGASKLTDVLREMLGSQGVSSKWLFRGTLKSSSLTSSFTSVVYGVATLSTAGESVTIISDSGKADVNFSGSSKDGRLAGQLGFSSGGTIFSGKAEGVFVAERISLTGQGQTADGLVQGSFNFVR